MGFASVGQRVHNGEMPLADFLTTDEAATELELKRISVLKLIERGKLEAKQVGGQWFIHKSEIARYKRDRKSPGRPKTKRGYKRKIGD